MGEINTVCDDRIQLINYIEILKGINSALLGKSAATPETPF